MRPAAVALSPPSQGAATAGRRNAGAAKEPDCAARPLASPDRRSLSCLLATNAEISAATSCGDSNGMSPGTTKAPVAPGSSAAAPAAIDEPMPVCQSSFGTMRAGRPRSAASTLSAIVAGNDDDIRHAADAERVHHACNERAPIDEREQLVFLAEAARGAGGEHDGGDARRQPAPRATLMISARIETAISAGPLAPMARPMGAWMRARSAAVKPAAPSRSSRLACVPREPSAPM